MRPLPLVECDNIAMSLYEEKRRRQVISEHEMVMNRVHERETRKSQGWETLADTSRSLEERGCGLLDVIGAHYDRSLDAWGASRKQHGGWVEYVQSWLAANGDRVKEQDVVAALRLQFPRPYRPMISPGRSYWAT